jgi:hypothetical protein
MAKHVVIKCKWCDEWIAVEDHEAISSRTILRRHRCSVVERATRYWW